MLPALILNFLTGLVALSLTSSVAVHDSRLDKAFISALTPPSDTASHDYGHSVAHELHVHGSRQTVDTAGAADTVMATRSHKRHTSLHHSRYKLATLVA